LIESTIAAVARRLAPAARALEHHPKQVTIAIAALLLATGGGAFAVANLGPDASELPVRQVIEDVQPLAAEAQSDAIDAAVLRLYRTDAMRATDTVEALLGRLGINDPAAAAFLRNDPAFRTQVMGRPGRNVTAEASDMHALLKLSVRWALPESPTFNRLVVEKTAQGGFQSRIETAPLVPALRLGSGTIRSSLFAAMDDSRLPDEVAIQMAEMFGGEIDFHRGMRKGDRFSVVYEALEADGEPLRTGRVISAEFVNNGTTHQAVWFKPEGSNKGAYFGFDGRSLERQFLASPMEFSRVTSGFAMRFHPIHQVWRQHLGVDYGAPTGTPVRTVADGVVSFAGVQNGYGNVIIVDHGKGDTTLYGHLSRIDVRQGSRVLRGQHIGAVGATGWATGPHLHFEFRNNGVHRDPLEVARQSQRVELSAAARPAFEKVVSSMRLQLAAAGTSSAVASAE
jgi:murein DD-endopeptidase MepM/ murein hydrolase activator NlpD